MTMTYGQIESSLQAAISATVPDDGDHYVYVCDFSDTFVIYCLNWDEYLQDDYTIDDDGNVTLTGSPVTVKPLTTYVAVEKEAAARAAFENRGLNISKDVRALMAARGVPELLGEKQVRSGQIKITSEPLTYHQNSRHSYFRDLLLTERVAGAAERLDRHRREMRVVAEERDKRAWQTIRAGDFGYERRVTPNTTDGQGGYFAPPLWLNQLFATAKRHSRVLSGLIPATFELPTEVSSINLPIITSGTTNQQSAENSAVPDSDLTDAAGSSNVITFSGDADVALQLLEQSPVGAMVDWVLWTDLGESYDASLETDMLYGLGSAYQQLPGVVPAASNKISYTDASPTGAEMWTLLSQAPAQVGDNRNLPPEVWMLRTARWAWIQGAESTSGYPFGMSPFFLGSDEDTPDPIGGMMGWPVFLNDAVSASLGAGANQDQAICLRPSDLVFFEGAPMTAVMRNPGSGNLSARVQMHSYAALITRYTSSIATVGGTGFAVQSGY